MKPDVIRDRMRRGVVKKSIEILRRHGKSDEEIRSIILSDFHIGEEVFSEEVFSEEGGAEQSIPH